jgi:hypothetical protein
MKILVPTPSEDQVKLYLEKWDSLDNYVLQERSLEKLFRNTYKYNNNMEDVLIKVCSLNDFYSTNIYSPFIVAKHIVALEIDGRLEKADISLVNDIANVKEIQRYLYSFATKYCSHHNPAYYPIYDRYVEKMLMYFKKINSFYAFKKSDLRDYPSYRNILNRFKDFYGLEEYTLKEIDKYLWQVGKEYFS